MQKISTASELRIAINLLELKQVQEGKQLKEQLFSTYDSFKSTNLVTKMLVQMATSPGLVSGVIKTIGDLTVHKSNKHQTQAAKGNSIKDIVSTLIRSGVTSLVVQNADTIRLFGHNIIQRLFRKKIKSTK